MNIKKILFIFTLLIIISCNRKNSMIDPTRDIIINMGSEPTTIDPTLNSIGVVGTYILHAFEGLTKIDKDNNIIPGMAEKWDISEDGITYIFYLRTNAKWSDGKPVTAYDFEYSWKRALDKKLHSSYSYMLDIIKNAKNINLGIMNMNDLGVEAINDNTLKVILETPSLYFIDFLASAGVFLPLRKDIIEKYGDEWTLKPKTYICNGQYILKDRIENEKIVFEENPFYYDKSEIIAKRLTFIPSADIFDMVEKIYKNELHFSALEPSPEEIAYLTDKGYIRANDAIGTIYLELNITNEALNDKRVRQALSLAIDRKYLVENVVKGSQTPAGAFVPTALKGERTYFREESSNFIDIDNYEKNVIKSKELMAEAGYPNGENYPTLELKVSPGLFYEVGKAIQKMWKDNLNIDVNLIEEEFPVTLLSLTKKKYQIARMGWTGDYHDPMTMLDIMVSYGGVNHSGFSNTKYDDLITEAKTTYTNNYFRMENMKRAEAILLDEMPIIPLYYKSDSFIVSPILKDIVLNPFGRHRFNYCYLDNNN
ncbi:peptide ABC transporter substrate-binding protein [Brachyspira suanatina]|uniref:Peptide ABC transporter substrate-binding protein n=1 Tax=Brachyspira suanatina TaxID=381802 RepID=A0A0G4K4G1_9SPIR|nr:peptide ABC transporter substrate-binding protein [Brachyspira suanatina]CRF31662.1 peptide ABC transporter substrate-binding protein [Brachyspira suanatina]